MSDVTRILCQIEQGDSRAASQLLPLVYEELRKLAAARMAQESPDHTLQATSLVHEAYLRLVGADTATSWSSRGHFFASAAQAMRRILVEHARKKHTVKRGGQLKRRELETEMAVSPEFSQSFLDLDEALERLEQSDRELAELVKLRVFAGLSPDQAALALGLSSRTAARRWAYARAWLIQEIREKGSRG